MKKYSGFEWLLIDAANNHGLDKLRFEERIEWAKTNLNNLENLIDDAENKPLYVKAVLAIRKAQKGIPTGHVVAVDGVCSGLQIMSALTGCISGARATGCVDPDRRADAYSETTDVMNQILGGSFSVPRKDAKKALMTTLYGSKATPKAIFGENTPQIKAFYEAVQKVAPGAWELLQVLLASWQAGALEHSWKLPDGFDARIKVMVKQTVRIEVDELNHSSFTYEYYENQGLPKGLSNAANVIHSMDAYVLREMHRRCNYNIEAISLAHQSIQNELIHRNSIGDYSLYSCSGKVKYYVDQYERSGLVSAVVLPLLSPVVVKCLSTDHLQGLLDIATNMLSHKPFPLVTVHDSFAAHANNVNQVRFHYKEILAEIADSNVLDDLLSQVFKEPGTFYKLSFNLGDYIRNSNYALC